MTVAVEDDKLSLAIGRNGQNARLASKLTGWKVNILSETEYNEMKKREAELLVPVGQLEGVGEKMSERLADADIGSVQRLAMSTVETLLKVEGIGQKTAETLLERAKAMVVELEAEYDKKIAEQQATEAAEAKKAEDERLTAEDVFEDDRDYVTEADDVREATAPDFGEEDIEDEAVEDEIVESDDEVDEDAGGQDEAAKDEKEK
jgi:N utilization substance protein A